MVRKGAVLLIALTAVVSSAAWAQLTTPPPDEMDSSVVKVLRTSNKAQVNQYVCKVYDIKNVNPFEIINFPEALAEAEEGMIYSFVAPDGESGKILVTAPEYQIPFYDDLIAAANAIILTLPSPSG